MLIFAGSTQFRCEFQPPWDRPPQNNRLSTHLYAAPVFAFVSGLREAYSRRMCSDTLT